ncbi:unnamed protein product [Durusdinium trenchii]|uniref:Uncharacterized protein n=1 Tax=Durusdinium trenchii TaxID=1381693 RepID=A0ABP0S247_9DINO
MVAELEQLEHECEAPVPEERDILARNSSDLFDDKERTDDLVDWLSQIKLTDERFLRATPAYRVVECAGRPLRRSHGDHFRHSQAVAEISKFISHSWQASAWSKIWTLLVYYNWVAAVLIGNLVACVAMILFTYDLLPGFTRVQRFSTEPTFQGAWSLSLGLISYVSVLLLRRPREGVFLDRCCVNQVDDAEKMEGLINMCACRKHSKKLLVIWDQTYCRRLWCIFEMAAFLKTHSLGGLLVQPLYMASFVLACNLVNTMAMCVDLVLPYESHFTVYMYILGLCAYAWLAGTAVVHFSESVTTAEQQLMTFKVANAQCYCCFVGHQVNGGELQCDRKVILQCLQHWFSSIQEFEKNVQNRVRKALTHQLGSALYLYHLSMVGNLPLLWAQMDKASARLRQGDAEGALAAGIIGSCGLVIFTPMCIAVVLLTVRSLRYAFPASYCTFKRLAGVLAFLVMQLMIHSTLELMVVSAGLLPGAALWSGIWLLPSLLLSWCASRLNFQRGAERQEAA